MAESSQALPSLTALIAEVVCSGLAPFIIYPSAPALKLAKTSLSLSREVKIRILQGKLASLILFVASIPSISGNPISSKITFGDNFLAKPTPFIPSSASPTSSIPSALSRTSDNPILVIVWSSTNKTFILLIFTALYLNFFLLKVSSLIQLNSLTKKKIHYLYLTCSQAKSFRHVPPQFALKGTTPNRFQMNAFCLFLEKT